MTNKQNINKAKFVKLVVTDIDGVWTDSKMYYSNKGLYMKAFSAYDGMAATLLKKYNFILAMVTSEYENIEILKNRADKLQIKELYFNEHKKLDRVKKIADKYKLEKNNIAYIGDDLNDLNALKYVGLSVSPKNAPILNYFKPDFITPRKGGSGAFRDLVDLLFKAQNISPKY